MMNDISKGQWTFAPYQIFLANNSTAIAARDLNAALAMHVELLTHASGDMTSWAVSPSLFHAQSKANECIARSQADHQTRSMKRKE